MFDTLKKNKRRILTGFLAAVLAVGTIATSTSPASAAVKSGASGTMSNTLLGKGSDGKYYTASHYTSSTATQFRIKSGGKNYIGYCINAEEGARTGWAFTAKSDSASSKFNSLNSASKKWLPIMMIYGYHPGKSAPVKGTNSADYYFATQVIAWEFSSGYRSSPTKRSNTKEYKALKGRPAEKVYNWILGKMDDHLKGASFTKSTKSDAKTYTMKYSYKTKKWSVTLSDTKKANYLTKLAASTDGLSVSRSGYKYTFSAKKKGTFTAVFGNAGLGNYDGSENQPFLIFQAKESTKYRQGIAIGATDETKFYVKLTTEGTGKAKIVKTTTNGGTVKGFKFKLTNSTNGYSDSFVTDASGLITANLYPGTYKVVEQLTTAQKKAGYAKADNTTIKIKAGDTTTINVKNEYSPLPKGAKIYKETTDDGPVEGFTFNIDKVEQAGTKLDEVTVKAKAAPKLSEEMAEAYDCGDWTVNADDLKAVNEAAEAGKTGDYKVRLTTKATLKAEPMETSTTASTGGGPGGAMGIDGPEYDGMPTSSATQPQSDPTEPLSSDPTDESAGTGEPEKAKEKDVTVTVTVHLKTVGEAVGGDEGEKTTEDGQAKYKDFTVANSMKYTRQTGTTNNKGVVDKTLEYGTYVISEAMTDLQAKRYHQPQRQTIVLSEQNQVDAVTFENQDRHGPLQIKKTSTDGKIADIEMTITGKTAWGEAITPIVAMTEDDGMLNVGDMPAGTYTVTESDLDTSVYLPQEPKTVTITGDEKEPVTVQFDNVRVVDVTFSKQSATTGEELPGATMQLKDKDGNLVEEWTSGEEPHVVKDLRAGEKYTLHEDLAPLGYACAQDIEFVAGDDKQITMVDELTKLNATKLDLKTREYVPGATYQILDAETEEVVAEFTTPEPLGSEYNENASNDGVTETDESDTPSDEDTADDGTTEDADNGPVSILRQIANVFNLMEADSPGTSVVVDPTKDQDDGQDTSTGEQVDNQDSSTNPTDESDDNATQNDQDNEQKDPEEDNPVDFDSIEEISDIPANAEYVQIEGLIDGHDYMIREVQAPDGYTLAPDEIFTFSNDANIALNEDNRGTITVYKTGEEYTVDKNDGFSYSPTDALEGCTFEVAAAEDISSPGGTLLVEAGTVVGTITTGADGTATTEPLYFGKYTLTEIEVPDGYKTVDPITVEVNVEDNTTMAGEVDIPVDVENTMIKGTVEITKKDVSTGETLPDTGVRIYDDDENVLVEGRTDENGVITFDKLPAGDYYYQEFDAPDGYELDESLFGFSIKEDGEIVKCEMTDQRLLDAAQTNDDTPLFLLVALAGAALIGIGGYAVWRRKAVK